MEIKSLYSSPRIREKLACKLARGYARREGKGGKMEKRLLPLVKQEIGYSIQAELLRQGENEYVAEIIKRLSEGENPCIANFITTFSQTTQDPVAAACCGALVYQILLAQAEADEIGRMLRL